MNNHQLDQHKTLLYKLLPERMKSLPEDIIIHIIGEYIGFMQYRQTFTYQKYYSRAIHMRTVFSPAQILYYFPEQLKKLGETEIVDEESFRLLTRNVICLRIQSAIIRMKKRSRYII